MIQTVLLGDIATLKYGKMPIKSKITSTGKYPIYSGYRITGYYDEYNCDEKLIVVARGVGGTGDVKISPPKAYLTNLSIMADLDEEIANKKYIYYQLTAGLKYLDTGSAQSQITTSDLKRLKVILPTLALQNKIVDILGSIDEKIELNRKMNDTLEQLGQALFRYYFIDNININKWANATSDKLFKLTMGLSPKGETYNSLGNGAPLLNGAADFTGASITPKRHTSSPTRISKPGDIIFCIRGTIGNVCIGYEEYCLGRGVAAMTPTEDATSFVYFSTIRAIAEMESAASGSVIRGLSKDDIAKRKIKMPPANVLNVFEKKALPLIKNIRNNSEQIHNLTTLRDTLLPRLIAGKIKL